MALSEFKPLTALIIQAQHAAFGESALDGSQSLARQSRNCRSSARDDGGRTFKPVEIILPLAWQHRANFRQCRIHLLAQGSVREIVDEFASYGQRAGFLSSEHDWRQVIAFDEAVADTGLADDGNPRLAQCRQIPIDRADADFEMRRE